jgi:hypothetical protein
MTIQVLIFSVINGLLAVQASPQNIELPYSLKSSDVEILWESGGGEGCASSHCAHYRITLRGDGVVTVEDLGWGGQPPRLPVETRSIKEDEFTTVLNQLLDARFLEAPADLVKTRIAQRKGDLVYFYYVGGGIGSWVDLTLHAGSYRKTVRLHDLETTTPAALRSVRDRIWTIGGINPKQ